MSTTETFSTFVSGAPAVAALTGTELVPLIQGGATVQAPLNALGVKGSFAAALSGMASGGTGTINYTVDSNGRVTLTAYAAITGTSNSTGMTLPSLPAAIQPAHAKNVMVAGLEDNGTAVFIGAASIAANGSVVTFFMGGVAAAPGQVFGNSSGFTATGTKGLAAGWTMTYTLD